jgi:Ca-activated chloride channel family protein
LWLAVLMTSASAGAQVDLTAWPLVRLPVLPLDAQDAPIAGLTKDALTVREDGQLAAIVSLEPDAEPQSVCLMIDASGSMYDRLPAVHAAARRILENLPAADEVCVTDFSAEMYMDQDFTQDRPAALKALGFIKASGGTALRDSLHELSLFMKKKAKYRGRVIILVSDGGDNASKDSEDQLRMEMEAGGIPEVHVLCVPSPHGRGCGTDEKAALRLTRMGGGLVYFPHNAADTDSAVDHLLEAMKARYVLTYNALAPGRDGGEHRVSVSFDSTHPSKKAVVRAPEGYYAPSR